MNFKKLAVVAIGLCVFCEGDSFARRPSAPHREVGSSKSARTATRTKQRMRYKREAMKTRSRPRSKRRSARRARIT